MVFTGRMERTYLDWEAGRVLDYEAVCPGIVAFVCAVVRIGMLDELPL